MNLIISYSEDRIRKVFHLKMTVYLKLLPGYETAIFIYRIWSTGGKQSSGTMSKSDGIAQTNQQFSMAKSE